jgi:hypothetical protein
VNSIIAERRVRCRSLRLTSGGELSGHHLAPALPFLARVIEGAGRVTPSLPETSRRTRVPYSKTPPAAAAAVPADSGAAGDGQDKAGPREAVDRRTVWRIAGWSPRCRSDSPTA